MNRRAFLKATIIATIATPLWPRVEPTQDEQWAQLLAMLAEKHRRCRHRLWIQEGPEQYFCGICGLDAEAPWTK